MTATNSTSERSSRASLSAWLVGFGAAQVVLGGLVAAAAGPLELRQGSWLAAYLVLVGGVAQYVLGRIPAWFGDRAAGASIAAQLVAWNAGNAAVIAGAVAGVPYLVDAGGLALLFVLLTRIGGVVRRRPAAANVSRQSALISRLSRGLVTAAWAAYVALLVILTVSIPVGLALAYLRAR